MGQSAPRLRRLRYGKQLNPVKLELPCGTRFRTGLSYRREYLILHGTFGAAVHTTRRCHLDRATALGLDDADWNHDRVYYLTEGELEDISAQKRTAQQETAASVIQKAWCQRKLDRFQMQLTALTRRLQRWWRLMICWRLPVARLIQLRLRRQRAATTIAAVWRGHQARSGLLWLKGVTSVERNLNVAQQLLNGLIQEQASRAVLLLQCGIRRFLKRRQQKRSRLLAVVEEAESKRACVVDAEIASISSYGHKDELQDVDASFFRSVATQTCRPETPSTRPSSRSSHWPQSRPTSGSSSRSTRPSTPTLPRYHPVLAGRPPRYLPERRASTPSVTLSTMHTCGESVQEGQTRPCLRPRPRSATAAMRPSRPSELAPRRSRPSPHITHGRIGPNEQWTGY